MSLPSASDILVVGAGPSGLALASELARRGLSALVIDRQAAGANTSRACVVHARTLEVLEPLGVVPDLRAGGIEVPIFRVRDRDRTLITVDFRSLPTRYPYTLMIPQSNTEAVLLAGLEAQGQTVLRPCELTTLRTDGEGASVTLRTPEGEHRLRARYVVGCDGMHSAVRAAAGIPFEGGAYEEAFVLADVLMDWPLSRDEVTLFYAPAGLMVVAPLSDRRFRVVATMAEAPAVPTIADVQALVAARGPAAMPGRVRDVLWSSRFHIEHRIAAAFRKGCVLLAGDAAHVHSPAGGQGMNTGIQDGVSLGRVLAGGSAAALDAWAARRYRIAGDVVRMTDRMTRAATIESRTGQAVRNAVVQLVGHFPVARQALAMRLSELSERAA